MDEYINRKDICEAISYDMCDPCLLYSYCEGCYVHDLLLLIKNTPAADVAEVRHGGWIQGDYYDVGDVCSECDFDSNIDHCCWRYCPNCGAKMDGKGEGE